MATWMEMDQFAAQINAPGFPGIGVTPAPCPADFDEGNSYWIKEYPIPREEEYRAASLPADVDVIIIGSGITGAAIAYELATRQPGLRVAMIEARGICTGATGRNGGHLCRPEAYDIRQLAETFGQAEAVRLRQLPPRNRDMMLDVIEKLDIAEEVDLSLAGKLSIFGSAEERKGYELDLEFARKAGMKCEGGILSPEQIVERFSFPPDLAQHGAAHMERSGTIYPRKLVDALLRHVEDRMPNFTIHPYNPVKSVSMNASASSSAVEYTVVTEKGSIRARAVAHATNAYASHLIPSLVSRDGVFGCKADVVAIQPNTTPAASDVQGGIGYDLFWHWLIQRPQNGPFIYGSSSTEKLLDYNDSVTLVDDESTHKHMKEWLESSLPRHFNSIEWSRDVLYSWSGVQAYTMDGTSCVGHPTKDSPGEFMSVGHNGEGMGRCFSCSHVLVDKLLYYLEGDSNQGPWSPPDWFPKSFLRNVE